MIQKLSFFFLFIPLLLSAQNDSLVKGKVVSDSPNLEDIHVINRSQKKGTITQQGGYFTLSAKVADTIIFSAVHLEAKQHIVKNEDFGENLLFVKLEPLLNTLEEITITNYKNINAVALGIVPANQKTYTPAERKLYTATGGGNRYGLSSSVSLDGILNAISGRTKMLQKEVQVERKEMLLEELKSDFSNSYFVEKLHIPEEQINGFLYYTIENKRFVNSYKIKNKEATEFLWIELSIEYLKLINTNGNIKKEN